MDRIDAVFMIQDAAVKEGWKAVYTHSSDTQITMIFRQDGRPENIEKDF